MTDQIETFKDIYAWSPLDHAEKCPHHPEFPKEEKERMVRVLLKVPPGTVIPKEAVLPALDCIQEHGVCVPDNLVVNAGKRAAIIAAQGVAEVCMDPSRIDPGDRRIGDYYVKQLTLPISTGLCRVMDLPVKRLNELEKNRQIRTGDRPADWILEARARAAAGKQPAKLGGKQEAMTAMQSAFSQGYDPDA